MYTLGLYCLKLWLFLPVMRLASWVQAQKENLGVAGSPVRLVSSGMFPSAIKRCASCACELVEGLIVCRYSVVACGLPASTTAILGLPTTAATAGCRPTWLRGA